MEMGKHCPCLASLPVPSENSSPSFWDYLRIPHTTSRWLTPLLFNSYLPPSPSSLLLCPTSISLSLPKSISSYSTCGACSQPPIPSSWLNQAFPLSGFSSSFNVKSQPIGGWWQKAHTLTSRRIFCHWPVITEWARCSLGPLSDNMLTSISFQGPNRWVLRIYLLSAMQKILILCRRLVLKQVSGPSF